MAWDIVVDRDDLRRAQRISAPEMQALAEGEVELAVERFAITANNITYGALGDAFGYWKFFPAAEGKGRIPVWGFATVVRSEAAEVPVGLRIFGYLPMSDRYVTRLAKGRNGFVDTSPHRAELPPTYNAYNEAPVDDLDDHRALLRPLFMTSWLLDDFLSEQADLKTLVLTSASSKTAMGLAWLARKRGIKVVGLTSPGNAARLAELDLYDAIVPYAEAGALEAEGPAVLVDFAGDRAAQVAVHTALGERLVRSLIVGATHWEARGGETPLPGPAPVLFFAPDQIRKRAQEWGPVELEQRFYGAMAAFVAGSPWLKVTQHVGPDALLTAYHDVLEGRARPDEGHIIRPV